MSHDPSEAAMDWRRGLWACLDLETTGLGPDDRIVEIALVMMRDGAVEEAWSSLVNPGIAIPAEATAVHGITDAMVLAAPTIGQLRVEVLVRLRRAAVVVGYHIYGADAVWLERELPGVLGSVPQIDPLVIVRSQHVGKFWKSDLTKPQECPICDEDKPDPQPRRKGGGRHRLARAAEVLGVMGSEPGFEAELHRAAWDALLGGRVLWALRSWCNPDPRICEARLRDEAGRQQVELDAFMAGARARDAETRVRRKASLAFRVRELETYCAKLEAAQGQPPFCGEAQ